MGHSSFSYSALNSSHKVYHYLKSHISFEQEEVWVVCLNAQKCPIDTKRIFIGTVNTCTFHPREIFHFVILARSSSFVVCHSHPSGNSEPSEQDICSTRKILKLSKLMEIPLDDHIILTQKSYFSFVDSKLLKAF